ncbi:MAG: hypothetical protein IPK79_00900 [Vampirovibrionales bacterium]|nr:hypothetical protein [Vampirovibrionales bacterium]
MARIYTRTMAPDVEIAARFNGQLDMADALDKVRRGYNDKIKAATTEAERLRLRNRKESDLADLTAMRDRLRGNYRIPDDPHGLAVRAGRMARDLNYLRLLGGITISAISDIARPVMVHGLWRTMRDGIVPLAHGLRAVRLSAEETKLAGTALDMVLDSRATALYDVMDSYSRQSGLERGLSWATSKFGVATLMSPWNAAAKQLSGMITQTRTLRAVTKIAEGQQIGQKEITRLARLGIDEGMALKIAGEFEKHGTKDSGVWWANTAKWTYRDAANVYRAALAQEVDEIIVTPGVGDKPLWMSTELGKVVGQFRSFGLAANQRVLLAGLQRRDAETLSGVALMTGLGMITYLLKQTLAGQEVSDDPAVWVQEGIDRSGVTGWLFDANNIAEKMTGGNIGISAITGKQGSRFASRNEMGAVLGANLRAGARICCSRYRASVAGDGFSSGDTHRLRKLVPLQNLFYLRKAFDEAEHGINASLGIPDNR